MKKLKELAYVALFIFFISLIMLTTTTAGETRQLLACIALTSFFFSLIVTAEITLKIRNKEEY